MSVRNIYNWGTELFEEADEVVAARHGRTIYDVRTERRRRGISHQINRPEIDWGDESFAEHDEVVAARHNTVASVVLAERLRRGISHEHVRRLPRTAIEQAAAMARVSKQQSQPGFTVRLRGLDVRCGSIEDLDLLFQRYGTSTNGSVAESTSHLSSVPSPATLPRVPARVTQLFANPIPVKHKKCHHSKCRHLAPILPTGFPAAVCPRHANKQTLKLWQRAEQETGKKVVYASEMAPERATDVLTSIERQVIWAVYSDEPNRTIATRLKLTEEQVVQHRLSAMEKLGVRSLSALWTVLGDERRRSGNPYESKEDDEEVSASQPSPLPPFPPPPPGPVVVEKREVVREQDSALSSEPLPALIQALPLDTVLPIQVDWLWRYRIPKGMVTVLYGEPGVGKGMLIAALAAAVSTGSRLPGDEVDRSPGNVLLVAAEDQPSVLRRRAEAAGAVLARVSVLGPGLGLRLLDHLADIERVAREGACALIVIDPFRGFVNGDSRREVRSALTSLEKMAVRLGVSIVVVHHTAKNNERSPLGSQDIVGIPRSLLFVSKSDTDEHAIVRRVTQTKTNLAPETDPVLYRITTRGSEGVVEWFEEFPESAAVPPTAAAKTIFLLTDGRDNRSAENALNVSPSVSEPEVGENARNGLDLPPAESIGIAEEKSEHFSSVGTGLNTVDSVEASPVFDTETSTEFLEQEEALPKTSYENEDDVDQDSDDTEVFDDDRIELDLQKFWDDHELRQTEDGEFGGGYESFVSEDRVNALGRRRQARAQKFHSKMPRLPYKRSPAMEQWRCRGCNVGVIGGQRVWHLERCKNPPAGGVDDGFEYQPIAFEVSSSSKRFSPKRRLTSTSVPDNRRSRRSLPKYVYQAHGAPGRFVARVYIVESGKSKHKNLGTFASVEEASRRVQEFLAEQASTGNGESDDNED